MDSSAVRLPQKLEASLDGCKLDHHPDRVAAFMRGEKIAPVSVDVALTRRCPYKCEYCYGVIQDNPGDDLSPEEIDNLIDDCAKIGVRGMSFVSDGESTAHPYLYEAIRRVSDKGMSCALATNGYLLDEEQMPMLIANLDYLRFNISAADRDRYAEIHGCAPKCRDKVIGTIAKAVEVKKELKYGATIGLQMVLMPQYADQILPLAHLGRDIAADYLIIKHCSDSSDGRLDVDYDAYHTMRATLAYAETLSTDTYQVKAKWSKILHPDREYKTCYGPQFFLQISGSGLVAPCGFMFEPRHSDYHIGNLHESRFLSMWNSARYTDIMESLCGVGFDAREYCGSLCGQHKCNQYLNRIVGGVPHVNFV